MDKKTRSLVEELADGLQDASNKLEEAACTCVDRSNGHEKTCSGITYVEEFDKLVVKARKALEEKLTITKFPLEYKGWKVEIKMGHEFKGSRGSVRNKRGYVATRIADGKVREFVPSYDSSPSVQLVKIVIDVEERGRDRVEA